MLKFFVVLFTAVLAWIIPAVLIQTLVSYLGSNSEDIGVFILTVFMSTVPSIVFGVMMACEYD